MDTKARRRLPIGLQTFRELREEDCYYVDKAGFIARLLDEGKHYFLSRPRRFGKSLQSKTVQNRAAVSVRWSRYGHGSGPTGRWRCRRPAPVECPYAGRAPDRIGSLCDDACPTAGTPDTGLAERLRGSE